MTRQHAVRFSALVIVWGLALAAWALGVPIVACAAGAVAGSAIALWSTRSPVKAEGRKDGIAD